jgi:hypothetical protein
MNGWEGAGYKVQGSGYDLSVSWRLEERSDPFKSAPWSRERATIGMVEEWNVG